MLSKRIEQLLPSPTLAIDAKAKEMQSQGIKVINLSLGEPDFDTPKQAAGAAIAAIKNGFTHYTATAGIPELRAAIARNLNRRAGSAYAPAQIIVGPGSKFLLYNIFQVLGGPGDEVLVFTPCWSTYVEQIKLAGATVKLIPLQSPFKPAASEVKTFLSPKTKIVLLNSPCNPTGATLAESELKKIGRLAEQKNFYIVSDEIYEDLIYGSKQTSAAALRRARERVIIINGFSKSFAMTGWRVGWAAGPQKIIDAMVSLQSQTSSNCCSIAQKAALAAATSSRLPLARMKKEFARRRRFVAEELAKIKGLDFTAPEGAFYFFISVKKLLNKKMPTAQKWCEELLRKEKTALVPGEAFLSPGWVRLSFATSLQNLRAGLKKIKRFVYA